MVVSKYKIQCCKSLLNVLQDVLLCRVVSKFELLMLARCSVTLPCDKRVFNDCKIFLKSFKFFSNNWVFNFKYLIEVLDIRQFQIVPVLCHWTLFLLHSMLNERSQHSPHLFLWVTFPNKGLNTLWIGFTNPLTQYRRKKKPRKIIAIWRTQASQAKISMQKALGYWKKGRASFLCLHNLNKTSR